MKTFNTSSVWFALIYFFAGIIWVVLGDILLFGYTSVNRSHIYKDIAFILTASVLLYFLLRIFRIRFKNCNNEIAIRKQFQLSIVESHANYLVRICEDYSCDFANKAYSKNVDLSKSELSSYNFLENIHSEDKERFIETLQHGKENKTTTISIELRHLFNNEVSHTYWEFRFIKNEKKNAIQIQGVGYDITTRIIQEKKLHLQNQQFKKIAFISSHTVRRPLANILGLTESIDRQNPCNPVNLEIIDSLKISAKELDSVIFDITAQITYTNPIRITENY